MIKIDSCFVHQEISVCHSYEKQKNIILTEKKMFFKTINPFLSNKVQSFEKKKTSWKR